MCSAAWGYGTETCAVASVYVELGVAYLCLCERTFPRSVAVKYLEELQREFSARHGDDVANASRPYHFVSFGVEAHWRACAARPRLALANLPARRCTDTVIQATKRTYTDARSQPARGPGAAGAANAAAPLSKVNEELSSVTRIMTTNIQDLLGRGERLDRTEAHTHTHTRSRTVGPC
jgi:vesicle transport protein SEC22